MSFWDRYLAPGDLRARRQALAPPQQIHKATQTEPETSLIKPKATSAAVERIDPAHRARRQDALFFGGLSFMLLGSYFTRRSIARKRLPYPKQFSPSNAPPPKFEGGVDAFEALSLATVWCVSVFMTGLGAAALWFDVADTEDLKDKVRGGMGFDVYGGNSDSEADKELEEWVASVMSRQPSVGEMKSEMVEKLMEMEAREMEKTKKLGESENQVKKRRRHDEDQPEASTCLLGRVYKV